MGLDMYLYKAKRPEYQKDEEFIPKEWFTNRGFTVLIKEELHGLMDELLPYCQQDTAMLKLIDIKQIIICHITKTGNFVIKFVEKRKI